MIDEMELDHECTSWMLFPDVTGGKFILHKNRDALFREITICKGNDPSKYKWVGLGSSPFPCMGISENGLAAVSNSGEYTFENETDEAGRMTLPVILKHLFENTTTAAEAVEKFKRILQRRAYTHKERGSIVFVLDTTEGYIIECTARHYSIVNMTEGFHVRANIWHNPGMEVYKRNPVKTTLNSVSRVFQATSNLNDCLVSQGKISLEAIWRISRLVGDAESMGSDYGLSNPRTNSASTLVADAEFPDVLSTEFVVIGPPRHSVYIPVPVCIDEIPSDIADFSWSHAAFARLDAEGLNAECDYQQPFEASMLADYAKAEEQARSLLRLCRRDEAVAIMRAVFADACNKARELALKPPKTQEAIPSQK